MAYDLGTARGTIELHYDGSRDVNRAQKDMEGAGKSGKDAEKDLAGLKKAFSGLGAASLKLTKIGLIGIGLIQIGAAAANAAIQVAGMVPALTSILSLSSALPGLLVGAAASVGVLKAAFAGVGDSIKLAFSTKATDVKKFNEDIKNLAPAAQQFAKTVQASVPTLKKFQQSIQQTFFGSAGLSEGVKAGIGALNQIKGSLLGLAGDFGSVTKEVVTFGTSSKTVGFVKAAIDEFRQSLGLVTPSIVPILEGLRSVGGVGLPLMNRLAAAVSGVATTFADWLTAIASDGRLQTWIDTALQTLRTLGSIASNVGGILVSIFKAAGDTAGGLLGNIATLTGGFNTFLKSAEGSAAIRSLFMGISSVASALTPVLTTLVGALAGALGPAISEIAKVAGPALLTVVQTLAPAFAPLAQGIADLVTAVAPLLVPLATLLSQFAQLAGGILSSVSAELGPLISLFAGGLTQALQTLAPVITTVLAQGLPLAAQAGQALLQAFAPLVPILVQVAQAFAQALLDNMPQIISLVQQLIPAIAQFATAMAGNLGTALNAIIPLIPLLVQGFVTFVQVFLTVETAIIKLGTAFQGFIAFMVSLPGIIGSAISSFVSFLVGGVERAAVAVGGAIQAIISFFAGLPGRIGAAIAALPGIVLGFIKSAATAAAFAFGQMIGTLVTLAVTVPPRIGAAIAALPGVLRNLAVNAWNAARAAFSSGIAAVASFASSLPGRVYSAISSLGSTISGVARAAWAAVRSVFSSGISTVAGVAQSLPGRIKSAVGNLGGLLAQAGRDAVSGLINGLKSGVGAAAAAARSLGSSILSGIKSTLKINSPSKAMIAIGRYVNQGLVQGLNGTAAQVKAASVKLANMVVDAFGTKKSGISAKAKNSVLNTLSKGNAQLQALASKSATVTARLKTAQDNLAAVQKQYNDAYASAVEKTKSTFNIVNPNQPVSLELSKFNLQKAVDQAKEFAANIQTLSKRGLNKDLLQQLVDAGAADGGQMAKALATASKATLDQFNGLQTQLSNAANSVGKTTADALYGAGVQAAAGLVKGLQNQEAAIQKQMDRIADNMVKSIKKALKIKSPSRVMFNLGKFTSEGLLNGINSLKSDVAQAAQSLATSSIIPTVTLAANTSTATTAAAFARSSPAPSPQVGGTFGPYNLMVDGKVFTSIVVDAVTGNPKVVANAANEGNRIGSWVGSGRSTSGTR